MSHIENFQFFFQWLAYIKYEWFFQKLEMAYVFAIKISIYMVCMQEELVMWYLNYVTINIILWDEGVIF